MGARRLVLLAAGLVGATGILTWSPNDDGVTLPGSDVDEAVVPQSSSEPIGVQSMMSPDGVKGPAAVFERSEGELAQGLEEHRVRLAVAGMTEALQGPNFDRSGWDRRVRAVAGSLGPGCVEELIQITTQSDFTVAEHVAAAELLRVLQVQAGGLGQPLGAEALRSLRAVVADTGELMPICVAAGRALVALGERCDRESLLSLLATSDDAKRRSWIAWSLPAATDIEVAYSLLDLARQSDRPGLMLATLGRWVRNQPEQSRDPVFVHAAVVEIEDILGRGDTPSEIRQRALATLSGLGPTASISVLERLILDSDEKGCERLRLAEAWSRLPLERSLSSVAGGEVEDLLLRMAQESGSPVERRRALFALGSGRVTETTMALAQDLRSDPEPSVQAAAQWVLESGERDTTQAARPGTSRSRPFPQHDAQLP